MHIFETRLSGTISKQNTSLLCNKMYIQMKVLTKCMQLIFHFHKCKLYVLQIREITHKKEST